MRQGSHSPVELKAVTWFTVSFNWRSWHCRSPTALFQQTHMQELQKLWWLQDGWLLMLCLWEFAEVCRSTAVPVKFSMPKKLSCCCFVSEASNFLHIQVVQCHLPPVLHSCETFGSTFKSISVLCCSILSDGLASDLAALPQCPSLEEHMCNSSEQIIFVTLRSVFPTWVRL